MKFKNILFDMDGTLLDSEKFYFKMFKKTVEYFGINLRDEQYKDYYSMSINKKADKLILQYQLNVESSEIVKQYRLMQSEMVPKADKSLLFKDTIETLDKLKEKGYNLYLCSNSRTVHIKAMLQSSGISQYFEGISSSDILNVSKPDPEFYLKSIELFGLNKQDCCVVEDSNNGIYSSFDAGLFTIGLKREFEIDKDKTNIIFDSLEDINNYLQ